MTALHQHGSYQRPLSSSTSADRSSGDRLYVGCVNGALQVYSFDAPGGGDGFPTVKLVKTYSWAKKAIDQIGVLGESNQLAVLSGQLLSPSAALELDSLENADM